MTVTGPLAFYQALQSAFDETLRRHAAQAFRIEALVGQAFDAFESNTADACAGEPPPACSRGCDACCTLRVSATAPEVLLVARFLRMVQPKLLERGIDLVARHAADALTRGRTESERVALGQPCPFAAQGVCIIYSVRPLACRAHLSFDASACAKAAAGKLDAVPHSEGQRVLRSLVQNALQAALRNAGLGWGLYELNHALTLALEDGTDAAWLRGEDPLTAARLPEIPLGEMAAVYDQLLAGRQE
jgi:hypothetical protein